MLSNSRVPFKSILGLVAVIIFVAIFPYTKLFIYNPIARPILLKMYAMPEHEKVLTEYNVMNVEFSKNSPFAVFQYHVENAQSRNLDSGTGLFNLETKKVVILAPKNPQPENSSIFSPDGKNVLFAVADEQKIECNTNRDGTWCSVKSYDLYLYNMESGTKTQLNSDTFPINLSGDAYPPLLSEQE